MVEGETERKTTTLGGPLKRKTHPGLARRALQWANFPVYDQARSQSTSVSWIEQAEKLAQI